MSFTIISKEEFLTHLEKVEIASFMQSTQMADLLAKRGYQVDYVALKQEDILVSAVLYSLPMTGGLHMEINCGPIFSNPDHLNDFYHGLQTFAKQQGALELIIKPYQTYQTFDSFGVPTSDENTTALTNLLKVGFQHDGLTTGYPGGEPDWHYVKDLTGISTENLLQSFSKKGKPLVKKANTFGIKLQKLERDQLHLFKEITSATSDRREYTDKSLDYYQDFYDSFGEQAEFMIASLNFQDYLTHLEEDQDKLAKRIHVLETELEKNPQSEKKQNQLRELTSQFDTFTIRKSEAKELIEKHGSEDTVLAASLFLYTEKEATYLFSGSYPEFNKFYAPALLQEHVMKEAIRRGLTFYNFLGIMGLFDGNDGVLRFKQNFNGYIVRKMGTFRYHPNPLKYKTLQFLKKLLGR